MDCRVHLGTTTIQSVVVILSESASRAKRDAAVVCGKSLSFFDKP